MRERTRAGGIRIKAVERNQEKSHTNGASSPLPLSLRKIKRMRRNVIHICERKTASSIRTEAVANQGESYEMVRLVLPLSLFFFFSFFDFQEEKGETSKRPLQNHRDCIAFLDWRLRSLVARACRRKKKLFDRQEKCARLLN